MTAPVIYIRTETDTDHAGTWCDVSDGGIPYVPQDKLTAAEAKLAKAVEALEESVREFDCPIARTTLAELKGQDDE